jgi:hypothetical protein
MKGLLKIVGFGTLVALLSVIAVGTVAYADDSTDTGFDFRGRVRSAVADILGITVEEYDAAVDQAQTQVVDEAVAEGQITEDQAEMMKQRMEDGPMPGKRGMGFGGRGFAPMGGPNDMISIAAEELALSVSDLRDAIQDGKSITDLAAEQGVDIEVIEDAVLAGVSEKVAEAVGEGRITQEQGEQMLAQAEERITAQLEGTGPGPMPPGGRGGRGGMQGDFDGGRGGMKRGFRGF